MARKLSDSFLNSFKSGELSNLLRIVREDDTLDMQFRGSIVTLYYRGCAILSIEESSMTLRACDKKYFTRCDILPVEPDFKDPTKYINEAKQAINTFISTIKENTETEMQQLIVRENNYSKIANETDYFIIDIEYKTSSGSEFDIVALRWDAESEKRRNPKGNELVIFEIKYGVSAIGEGEKGVGAKKATLSTHVADFKKFVTDTSVVDEFKKDMLAVFKQKRELGLIRFKESVTQRKNRESTNKNEITEVADQVKFGIILCNYNPRSEVLKEELARFRDDFIFPKSSFMGYGLYVNSMGNRKDLEDIIR